MAVKNRRHGKNDGRKIEMKPFTYLFLFNPCNLCNPYNLW